jgi:hypothetical protein
MWVQGRTVVTGIVGALLATLLLVGPVAAEQPGVPAVEKQDADLSEIEYFPSDDISDAATETVDQSVASPWQAAFALIVQEIRDEYPDDLTEAEVDPGQDTGVIRFRGDPPTGAVAMASSVPGVRLEGGLRYTESDIDTASRQLLLETTKATGDEFESMTYFDSRDDSFHVEVAPAEPGTMDTARASGMIAGLQDELTDANLIPQIPILVDYVAYPVVDDEAWVAGYALYRAGVYHCSTAFPVKNVNGPELGILTAGHCSGSVSYANASNFIFTVVPYSQSTTDVDPGGDFRWLWSSQMFTGQTQVSGGDL